MPRKSGKRPAPVRQTTVKTEVQQDIPAFTGGVARELAKLLHVGCPVIDAVSYIAPRLTDPDLMKQLARLWLSDPLTRQALSELQGGAWMDLPLEKRLLLAQEKSDAEAGFYLYANNFNTITSRDELEKFKIAREIVRSKVQGEVDETDPLKAFARFALDVLQTQNAQRAAAAKELDPEASELDRLAQQLKDATPVTQA